MNNYEAYQMGQSAGFEDNMPPIPPWAQVMGFCQAGCYAYVTQDDLAKECKGLRRTEAYHEPAYLEVIRQPADLDGYRTFFRELELLDVNLIADSTSCHLVCYGASLSKLRSGGLALNGRFQILVVTDEMSPEVKINLRASLIISKLSTTHTTVSTAGVVGYFKIPCRVTMNPDDFNLHWASFGAVDNPLFGFFNETMRQDSDRANVKQSSQSTSFTRFPRLSLHSSSNPH